MFPVEVLVAPIVRESDGLALSSRNVFLSPQERKQANVLSRALYEVEARYKSGETNSRTLVAAARQVLSSEPSVRLDYVEIVDNDTLEPAPIAQNGTLLAVAAFVGTTRLIDNVVLGDANSSA
jgi:pantoate--beta-alanine ligase